VHVEGERRGRIALSQLLCHQAVSFIIGAKPAVALGHAQAEEPLGAEIGIVVEWKGRVAVVAVGARGEPLAGQADQLALPGGRLEVHLRAPRADHICANKLPPRPNFKPAGSTLSGGCTTGRYRR